MNNDKKHTTGDRIWIPASISTALLILFVGLFYLYWLPPDNAPQRIIVSFDAVGIITGAITSIFTIVAVGYAYIRRESLLDSFKNRMARPEFHNTGHKFAENVDAVIIPVSNRGTEQPQWIINHLKPRFAALVCSKESCANGLKLLEKYSRYCTFLNTREEINEAKGRVLGDPKDPEQAKHLSKAFIVDFLRRDVSRGKIFVDTTGGMVPMSIGLFQGAEEEGVSTIYINGFITNPDDVGQGDPIFMSDRTPDAHIT